MCVCVCACVCACVCVCVRAASSPLQAMDDYLTPDKHGAFSGLRCWIPDPPSRPAAGVTRWLPG